MSFYKKEKNENQFYYVKPRTVKSKTVKPKTVKPKTALIIRVNTVVFESIQHNRQFTWVETSTRFGNTI